MLQGIQMGAGAIMRGRVQNEVGAVGGGRGKEGAVRRQAGPLSCKGLGWPRGYLTLSNDSCESLCTFGGLSVSHISAYNKYRWKTLFLLRENTVKEFVAGTSGWGQ